MKEEKSPTGIGGWLILVAFVVVITPIRSCMLLMRVYTEVFSSGTWGSLTTEGGELYNSLWGPLIIGEILFNIGFLLAWLYMTYLFFSKKKAFPLLYISLLIISLLFAIADTFVIKLIFPNEAVFGPDALMDIIFSVTPVMIWVPYILLSDRVKATFVK